jgi:DeoR-like protein with HTH domain
LECFRTQLLDAEATTFRLQRYKPAPAILPLSTGDAADPNAPTAHKQISGAVILKILHASQTLTVAQLSARFNVSNTNIRRILQLYSRTEHVNLLSGSKMFRKIPTSRPFSITGIPAERKAQP